MTPAECARLLAKVQAYDGRNVGKADIAAWFEALAGVPLDDALAAVALHFRDSTDWIMPAHVRRMVKTVRTERRRIERRSAPLALPSRFEADDDRADRIAAGIAACRAQLGERAEPLAIADRPASRSEQIRTAALARAAGEPRDRRTDPTSAGASLGAALNKIRHATTPTTANTPGDHR